MRDKFKVVSDNYTPCEYFVGGGATEMALSGYLREAARNIRGREQLLITAMARAFEIIPRQLCDNAGLDATSILNQLRHCHAKSKSTNRGST